MFLFYAALILTLVGHHLTLSYGCSIAKQHCPVFPDFCKAYANTSFPDLGTSPALCHYIMKNSMIGSQLVNLVY